MIKRLILLLLLIVPGVMVTAVCIHYALLDWNQLQPSYNKFQWQVGIGAGMRDLFITEAAQNIHRLNLFADGVWALLGAILAGIGIHGLCLLPAKSSTKI